jgi:hypothetical protein
LIAVFNVGGDTLLLLKLSDDLGMLFSQSGQKGFGLLD